MGEKLDCICQIVDSGEPTHGEGCPLYEAPAAPEQAEAVKNVLALINALPTMAELGEQDTDGGGSTGGGGGGGGSSSGGGSPSITPPSITQPKNNVIDIPVGNNSTANTVANAVTNAVADAVADAVKNAIASGTAGRAGTTANVNYANYSAITVDGIKAINDAAAKAIAGKNLQINTQVQFDTKVNNEVVSRVTVDPVKLASVMTEKLGLNVWFDQKKDKQVTSVKRNFEKNFNNRLVVVTFEQKAPLSVNMELALKPDMSGLNTKNLYFYSYDPTKNTYSRIIFPSYWLDKASYSHITAPFGGSIIITDSPLTSK